MHLEIEETGTSVVLRLSGERDLEGMPEDRPEWDFAHSARLQRLLESGSRRFVLDVRRAGIDSILIAALCAMSKQIDEAGGELRVVAEETQRQQFKAGRHEVVETCRSLEEAFARFRPEP